MWFIVRNEYILMTKLLPYNEKYRTDIVQLFRMNVPAYFAAHEEADLLDYLAKHGDSHYVMTTEEAIVGTGGYVTEGDTGVLSWYFVHPDHYGKGTGSAIAQHCLNILKEDHTLKQIIVRTSQLAYPFFARFGFEVTKTVKDYWGKGFDLYYMQLKKEQP